MHILCHRCVSFNRTFMFTSSTSTLLSPSFCDDEVFISHICVFAAAMFRPSCCRASIPEHSISKTICDVHKSELYSFVSKNLFLFLHAVGEKTFYEKKNKRLNFAIAESNSEARVKLINIYGNIAL